MKTVRRIFAMITMACLALAASAQSPVARSAPNLPPSDQALAAFMHGYMVDAVRTRDIPGATLVVMRNGKPILAKAYGKQDYQTQQPMNVEKSVFRLGSTAKLYVWLLVMQLVEERQLDLDADINHYLDFKVPPTFDEPITLRHLMTHSAGFDDRIPMVSRETRDAPLRTRLIANMPDRVSAPGTTVAYSNYSAALAAYIVEQLRGKPLEALVAERIFNPLGMTSSTLDQPLPAPLSSRLVSYYGASSRVAQRFEYVGLPAAGSASGSTADMRRFITMLMNGGKLAGHRIVGKDSLAQMMRLQTPLLAGLPAGFGLGFIVGEHRGTRYAGHGGNLAAGSTDLQILPDHGLSWYIAFNGRGFNGSAAAARQQLLLAVIDRFYRSHEASPQPGGISSSADIAGSYFPARRTRAGLGELIAKINLLEVSANADGSISIDQEGKTTRWLPHGNDKFVEEKAGGLLAVERDAAGRVNRLGSPLINSVSVFERVSSTTKPALYALVIAPPILLTVGIAKLVGWGLRKRRQRRGLSSPLFSRLAGAFRRVSVASHWMIAITVIGWLGYFAGIVTNPGLVSARGAPLLVLNMLALLTSFAALVLVVDSIWSWKDPSRSWWSRLTATIAAPAATALALPYLALNIAIPKVG